MRRLPTVILALLSVGNPVLLRHLVVAVLLAIPETATGLSGATVSVERVESRECEHTCTFGTRAGYI